MPRWEPDARTRLVRSAVALFAAQGFDGTTVGDIAAHAGVTARTYFRYFPDKREVLFGAEDEMRRRIADALAAASADLVPLAAAVEAMASCDDMFHADEHGWLRRRELIIDTSQDLQEREARKRASIGRVVADRLVERGSEPGPALLVADLAVAVFVRASRLWMDHPTASFARLLVRALDDARSTLDVTV